LAEQARSEHRGISGGLRVVAVLVLAALIALTGLVSFLLFHTVAEVMFAVVGFGVLIMAMALRQFLDDDFPVFVGIALGTAALLELVHTVDFPGMNVISGTADTSAQMWIAARTVLAASFVFAPFVLGRRLRLWPTVSVYAAVAALALAAVYWWEVFPSAYTMEHGATRFKVVTESVVCGLFALAIVLLWRRRARLPSQAFPLVVAALVASIVAELWLTLHTGPQSWPNMVGLVFLVVSAILVYLGLVEDGLARPHVLAVANLREAQRLHERLEKSLLPTLPVRHPTVDVVTYYRPGSHELELGGDFIDVVDEGDGRLAVICGDVSGHGPDAAALGAMMRVSWQALVGSGAGIPDLVDSLRGVLARERSDPDTFATACLAWIDPNADELLVVNLGHPLPLLIADAVTPLEVPALPPLGSIDVPVREAVSVALPQGWTLLFYTDGLIEGRASPGAAERFGEDRLIATLERLVHGPVDAACIDRVMRAAESAGGEPIGDDVTVIVVAKRPAAVG
jgi:serine phosphatase RsbU (regulator of sigma subunit)